MFTWITPLVTYTKKYKKLKVELYGDLRNEDRVETQIVRLRDLWNKKKIGGPGKNALVLAVLASFKW